MPATYFHLPNALIFRFTGKDSNRYLNARLSNNIRDLPAGRGCAAAALSPQGRTEVFGVLLKLSQEEFYYIVDGGDASEIKGLLTRYLVADRVVCDQLTDMRLVHLDSIAELTIGSDSLQLQSNAPEFAPTKQGEILFFHHQRISSFGKDLLLPSTMISSLTVSLSSMPAAQVSVAEQDLGRVRSRRPNFPQELNDGGIFLEAGLSHAVSFTKGCYVGQEVLEKVDSHGRLPYSIVSLQSKSPGPIAPASAAVMVAGESCGEVITTALDESTGIAYCFARVKTSTISNGQIYTINSVEYQLL